MTNHCSIVRRLRPLICIIALASAGAASAGEDSNIYLAQAKVFYQGLEFEKCLQRLEQAGRLANASRSDMAQIELYTGLCKFNLGKRAEAEGNFKIALELDPEVSLPAETSPRISEVFDPLAAQAKKNRPAPKQVAAASPSNAGAPGAGAGATSSGAAPGTSSGVARTKPSDAPKTVTLAPNATGTEGELAATAPEHGSKVLPITLGATSVAAAGLAVVLGAMAKSHEAQANSPTTFYGDAQTLGSQAKGEATAANVCIGVAVAAAAGAAVTWITSE